MDGVPRPVSNPPNPWSSTHVEWLGPPPDAELRVLEEQAKSVLSKNASPDLPFDYSLNPYRGCTHACAYCYARPTHQYLGFGAGTDFDRTIVVKTNAPEVLHRELSKPSWSGAEIVFSGNTDCYQPLEASYELTRRCLEVCLRFETPVGVITKGVLVRRDVDLLARLASGPGAEVHVSIAFDDAADARRMEPGTPTPEQRFETLRILSEAGIPTAVSLAPMIPGLNDHAIPAILRRASAAGARRAFLTLIRLPAEVGPVFEQRLRESFPGRADRVLSAIAEERRGSADGRFGTRMHGHGPRWEALARMFEIACRRFDLATGPRPGPSPREVSRRAPPATRAVQRELFDD
jgi:DNA repair photolyase